ncbi:MAG TPA: dihydropteroate synthase [Burkholderiales bacterium]|nr:dihydropteroate synthase [Burkholderiales bacterium]
MEGARAPSSGPGLRCGRFLLPLTRPLIMGVINITPDSFSDGGRFLAPAAAIEHANRLVEEGADMLDLGAESTRPGAAPVTAEQEAERVLPVLDAVRGLPLPVSIETRKPDTMRLALTHGASMINDIDALQAPGALEAVRRSDCGLCLMHKQGDPQTMQVAPAYTDLVREVKEFLAQRLAACAAAGIARERLVVDPGFGFGKTAEHNLELLRRLGELAQLGVPVLAGLSRKTTLGKITGRAADDRLAASMAAALLAVQRGATIVRVHDVAATRDALLVLRALEG